MIRAEIVTPWAGTGADGDSNRPKLADDYQLKKWEDTTGQPARNLRPDPNLYIIKVECEQPVLDAINADPAYCVMWREELVEEGM